MEVLPWLDPFAPALPRNFFHLDVGASGIQTVRTVSRVWVWEEHAVAKRNKRKGLDESRVS